MSLRSLLTLAAAAAAAAAPPAIPSSVWPLPASISLGATPLPIAANFALLCAGACPAPLPAALARYNTLLFIGGAPAYSGGGAALPSLLVTVLSDAALSPDVNESYALRVPADGSPASLSASTQWGALRGLESFLQLVVWAGPDAAPGAYAVTAAPAAIDDAPRFSHRGVLIDTSFNFLTVARVKEVIESMPVTKSNVLHWHILDDPAWPMESLTYPAFTAPGSGGPYARVATYSAAQQAEIKSFAWERGVMILLEYDVPGHCASWAAGAPALVSACAGHETLINPVGEPGARDGSFYEVLEGLMREFGARIGTPGLGLVHLGGDEVTDYTCWLQSPQVQAWASAIGVNGSDAAQIRRAFTTRVQAVAASVGLRAAFWEESFTEGDFNLTSSAIITPWVNPLTAARAAAKGHDVINYAGFYVRLTRTTLRPPAAPATATLTNPQTQTRPRAPRP
jgi:hexosaminidase